MVVPITDEVHLIPTLSLYQFVFVLQLVQEQNQFHLLYQIHFLYVITRHGKCETDLSLYLINNCDIIIIKLNVNQNPSIVLKQSESYFNAIRSWSDVDVCS